MSKYDNWEQDAEAIYTVSYDECKKCFKEGLP